LITHFSVLLAVHPWLDFYSPESDEGIFHIGFTLLIFIFFVNDKLEIPPGVWGPQPLHLAFSAQSAENSTSPAPSPKNQDKFGLPYEIYVVPGWIYTSPRVSPLSEEFI
jgi:hypothetical protein